jgi:hypothetical protein
MPYSGSPDRPRRPVPGTDHPGAHVADRLVGELDEVEQIHRQDRVRQHPADRRGVDAAQVDADHLDRLPPRRGGPGQPVRGVIGGTGLHLAQQAPAVRTGRRTGGAGKPPTRYPQCGSFSGELRRWLPVDGVMTGRADHKGLAPSACYQLRPRASRLSRLTEVGELGGPCAHPPRPTSGACPLRRR